jgi:hypothetical protein
MRRILVVLIVACLTGCGTTRLDLDAFRASGPRTIGIVIGCGARGKIGLDTDFIPQAVYVPLPAEVNAGLAKMVEQQLCDSLATKGYSVHLLKMIDVEWDVFSNTSDSAASYARLLQRYGITPKEESVDALLIAEFLLQPKTQSARRIRELTLSNCEVTYAKSKLWLYDLRTGKRLFFSTIQRGYEEMFSHVTPEEALKTVFNLKSIPAAQ